MKKALLRTYGCQMNERDSENIAAMFVEKGWEITEDEKSADVIVINTCSVREQAEQKVIGKLWHLVRNRNLKKAILPIIGITGCMAQNRGEGIAKEVPGVDFIAGPHKTHKVADIAIEVYNKRIARQTPLEISTRKKLSRSELLKQFGKPYIDIADDETSHLYINRHLPSDLSAPKVSGFVSIMQGCQMNCSYCIVPKVRGLQRSRPTEDIVNEVEVLVSRGLKEITLLGQVVNAFGREMPKVDGKTEFVRLLQKLNDIDGLQRIRFTSPHPSYFGDDLIRAYSELPKLCEYVHLPLQSGSDEILKKMNRPYRAQKFLETVDKLRQAKPNISISTDVIVGFPTESDEDFEQTRQVFRKSNFDMAFIFKYSPRIGTKSAEQPDDVSEEVKEARNQTLLADLEKQSLDFNNALVSTVQEVLVEAPAKRGEDLMMGRTRTHRKVIFPCPSDSIGKMLNIKIESATVTALTGKPV